MEYTIWGEDRDEGLAEYLGTVNGDRNQMIAKAQTFLQDWPIVECEYDLSAGDPERTTVFYHGRQILPFTQKDT